MLNKTPSYKDNGTLQVSRGGVLYNMQATLFSQRRVSQKWTAALKVAISPTLKVAIFPTLMQLVLPGLGEKRICGEFFGGTLFKWDIIPIAR